MFCRKCGKEIDDASKLCEHCGHTIESDIQEETTIKDKKTGSEIEQESEVSQTCEKEPVNTLQQPQKGMFNLKEFLTLQKIPIIVIGIIVLIIAIIVFLSSPSKEKLENRLSRSPESSQEKNSVNQICISRMNSPEGKLLQNGKYKTIFGDTVKLKNGEYEHISKDDFTLVKFECLALGNLDNQGGDDAAVILWENGGGDGVFYQLFAVINHGGSFQQKGKPLSLGDRIIINSINIKNGVIIIDMLMHDLHDGMCCPTYKEIAKYKLIGDKLTRL